MAKKDWDGDGKVESEKDEVWGSRFKAAKKAGKMEEAKKWCESCESSKCTCKKMEESRDAATLGPKGQSGNTRARFAAAQQQKAHKQQLAGHVDDWTSSDEAPRINAAQDDGDEDALHQSATRYASGLKDHQRGFTTPESYARKMVAHLGEEVESIFSEEELAHFEAVMERGAEQNITTKKSGGDKVAETVPTRDLTN